MNILSIGGSGHVSGAVVKAALAAGHNVWAITRGPKARSASRVDCTTFQLGSAMFRVGSAMFQLGNAMFRVGNALLRVGAPRSEPGRARLRARARA